MTDAIRIAQISDLHLGARRSPQGIDGDDGSLLKTALAQATALESHAVVLSGDLIDRSAPMGYEDLGALLEDFHRRSRIPIVPVMGNHDRLLPFLQGLSSFMGDAERRAEDSTDHVRNIGGLQLVALNSAVPGEAYGAMDAPQLRWLREVAQRPTPLGTCVVLHHPPILSPMPQLRYSSLADPESLAAALDGLDIRVLLCGHFHHTSTSLWEGHLVWAAPALSYSQDLAIAPPTVRGWPDTYFSLIDISRTSAVCTAAIVTDEDAQPTLVTPLDIESKRRRWNSRQPWDQHYFNTITM